MKGTLYGVGVGPGDPELMTLKAVRIIRECDVIVLPAADRESCTAYQTAVGAVPEISGKECLCIKMPMTKDEDILRKSHKEAAAQICGYLDAGRKVVYLTIGDPTVYSTYMYVHAIVREAGCHTEIVSGITSFCASAARLGISLGEKMEAIHIIPASCGVKDALGLPGTKILMKSGKKLEAVKNELSGVPFYAVQNCGMKNENITREAAGLSTENSYFTTIIVKQGE